MSSKRQLLLDILARDRTKQATDSAAGNIDDVAEAAEAAAKSTDDLGDKADKAEDKVERLGKSSRTAAEHLEKLDHEIHTVEKELHQLAVAFAEAETAADRLDLSRAMRRTQADLKKLTNSKNLIKDLLPDPDPQSFMKKLAEGIASAPASLSALAANHVGITIGAAAGAAAAPVLVSALGSALSAQTGALGLGLGIKLAVKGDKDIQVAGKTAGEEFLGGMQDAASRSLKGPILDSLTKLSAAGDRITARWDKSFQKLAHSVDPLTNKLITAGERINDSLASSAERSGPALDALADSVVLLSDAVGDFIDTVSDGGPEAADNLRLLAGVTGDVVKSTGNFLGTLSKLANNPWLTGPLLPALRKHYKGVAEESEATAEQTRGLGEAMASAADAATGQRTAMKLLSKELKAQADPVFGLMQAQEDLAGAQKKYDEAVAKHGRNSKEARSATRELADSAIGLQGAVGALGGAFTGKLSPAMLESLRNAKLSEAQIAAVEREFQRAKTAGDAYSKNYKAGVSLTGVAPSIKQLRSLKEELASMKTKWTVTIRQNFLTFGKPYSPAGIRSGNVGGLAGGGPVIGPGPKGQDSELRLLAPGEHVWSADEVDAVGGQKAMLQLRATARAGRRPQPYAPMASAAAPRAAATSGGAPAARLELHGEATVVAFVRKLIKTHNLLEA